MGSVWCQEHICFPGKHCLVPYQGSELAQSHVAGKQQPHRPVSRALPNEETPEQQLGIHLL